MNRKTRNHHEVKAIKAHEAYSIMRQNPELDKKSDEVLSYTLRNAVRAGKVEAIAFQGLRINFYNNIDVIDFTKNYKKAEYNLFDAGSNKQETKQNIPASKKDFCFTVKVTNNFDF